MLNELLPAKAYRVQLWFMNGEWKAEIWEGAATFYGRGDDPDVALYEALDDREQKRDRLRGMNDDQSTL